MKMIETMDLVKFDIHCCLSLCSYTPYMGITQYCVTVHIGAHKPRWPPLSACYVACFDTPKYGDDTMNMVKLAIRSLKQLLRWCVLQQFVCV